MTPETSGPAPAIVTTCRAWTRGIDSVVEAVVAVVVMVMAYSFGVLEGVEAISGTCRG